MFDGVIENPIALAGLIIGMTAAAAVSARAWLRRLTLGTQAPMADTIGLVMLTATWLAFIPLNVAHHATGQSLILIFGAEANDSGVVELLTVAGWGFALALCLLVAKGERGWMRAPFLAGAVAAFYLLGEEISWGQWILHWKSSAWFAAHNLQSETNSHNFLSPVFYDWAYRLIGWAIAALAVTLKFRTPLRRLPLFDRLAGWINHTRWGLPLALTAAALMQHAAFQELCEVVLAAAVVHALLAIHAAQPARIQGRLTWALTRA
ncbi:MAG: hypothetical protein ACXW3D_05935 [Caulobacteraceae bacterium]